MALTLFFVLYYFDLYCICCRSNKAHANIEHSKIILNEKLVDSAIKILQSGNIILRMGLGADSRLLAQLNQKDKSFSHCGIVLIENNYPFVYHCIGGEDNPNEILRRDSAKFFFSPLNNTAIGIIGYDFGEKLIENLKLVVNNIYKRKPKFDLNFDLKTDDKLYCAEFVYKAINLATGDSSYIATTNIAGYRYVGIDNLFINTHAHIIWQTKFK